MNLNRKALITIFLVYIGRHYRQKKQWQGLSLLYNTQVGNYKDSTEYRKTGWMNDLQVDISGGDWRKACMKAR